MGYSGFAAFVVFRAHVDSHAYSTPTCTDRQPLESADLHSSRSRRGQYMGDLSVTSWNAQALFATDMFRFEAKSSYVNKMMLKSDICLITESHGSETSNSTWRAPLGSTAWWSEGASHGQAGVGVIIRDSFLQQFTERPRWVHIWKGRAAKLCLRGPLGALDIVVVYGHAGSHRAPVD
ncbi:unnamed protein product [Prorocentrum cordatum]|uniref:Uncharacterized protein n=1 Tax=Prorocentrum cordatum TaxID=2364126 RepID=A0ABN9T5A4_9DINO|nr:unnamed protein product [Polarella glacialis]